MAAVAVGSSAAVAVVSGGGTRREVHVSNVGTNTAYLDTTSAVTSTTGYALAKDAVIKLAIGENQTLYARCADTETADLRWVAF